MITDINGVRHIEFGGGTIIVGAATWEEEGALVGGSLFLSSSDKHPIGTQHPECCGKDAETQGADTLLIFKSSQSVDIVIEYLQEIKKSLVDMGK